jgi:hypothetical protein
VENDILKMGTVKRRQVAHDTDGRRRATGEEIIILGQLRKIRRRKRKTYKLPAGKHKFSNCN